MIHHLATPGREGRGWTHAERVDYRSSRALEAAQAAADTRAARTPEPGEDPVSVQAAAESAAAAKLAEGFRAATNRGESPADGPLREAHETAREAHAYTSRYHREKAAALHAGAAREDHEHTAQIHTIAEAAHVHVLAQMDLEGRVAA